jgi:hypothetical protein
MSGISRDEWLAALGESAPNDPSAFTIQELVALLGFCRSAVKERISRLVKEGKAIPCSKQTVNASGAKVRLPAYKLVTPPTKT